MNELLSLSDFGPAPDVNGLPGVPARIVAQHRERYEIVGTIAEDGKVVE